MLDFRRRKGKTWKPKSRNTKEFKSFEGTYSTAKRLTKYYLNRAYIPANMKKWLHTRVGKPVDMVYSEFLKDWNRSASRNVSPKEYFYSYVNHSKDDLYGYWRGISYYISNGILCERHRSKTRYSYSFKSNWSKKQIEYNKAHCPELDTLKDGPIFLGKLWARIPGYTRLVNVWMISNIKLGKEYDVNKKYNRQELKLFLEDFVEVTLAGIAPYIACVDSDPVRIFATTKKYSFIAKLSDIK